MLCMKIKKVLIKLGFLKTYKGGKFPAFKSESIVVIIRNI